MYLLSQGRRRGDFKALAVSTNISPPASPCGMCRQFIREFCEVRRLLPPPRLGTPRRLADTAVQGHMPVLMYDSEGKYTVMTVEQLLPMSFGPEALLPKDEIANA